MAHAPTHAYTTRIYYADTDAGGVVYHANYLDLAERARTESMYAAGTPHAEMLTQHDCQFMVRRVNLEYLRPARLDDMVTITTRALSQTPATLTLRQTFTNADGARLADLEVELVCVRPATAAPPASRRAGATSSPPRRSIPWTARSMPQTWQPPPATSR